MLIADALAGGVLDSPFGPELAVPGWTLLRHRERQANAAQKAVWGWLAGLRLGDAAPAGK